MSLNRFQINSNNSGTREHPKSYNADTFDSTKYAKSDAVARPILMNQFKFPTPIVNIVADYCVTKRKFATSQKRILFTDLKSRMASVSLFEHKENKFIYFLLLDEDNLIFELVTVPILLKSVVILPFKLDNNRYTIYVELDQAQFNFFSLEQIELCVVQLERDFKHKFNWIHFSDDVKK